MYKRQVIHFEYKAMKKGTKQDALVQSAISKILADKTVQQHWVDLAKREMCIRDRRSTSGSFAFVIARMLS